MRSKQEFKDKLGGWLLGAGAAVPEPISAELMKGLFSSLPIFLGGIVNTIIVATIGAWRHPTFAFFGWASFEIVLGLARLVLLLRGQRALRAGQTPPRLQAAILSCAWAASVGFGTFLCLASADWVLAAIACLSAAAMTCGICLRNFGTPRLAGAMVFLALAPCAVAGLLCGEPVVAIISIQLPLYMLTIFAASSSLCRLMVSRMSALSELQRSESLNATILRSSPDYTLILDESDQVVFCNQPEGGPHDRSELLGRSWVTLLPEEDRAAGICVLHDARTTGRSHNLITYKFSQDGQKTWYDVIANRILDGGERLIVVARDITHQKKSEEQAIWMAQHDALTGLPNRAVLQEQLDAVLANPGPATRGALLLLDVDNFKSVNDTLGHDAGDELLSTFAAKLRAAASDGDLVARTGGDEFALLVNAGSDAEVERIADRIFTELREPFSHAGRLIECGASIGASFIRRDGKLRSEIMKAADIALYAAKTGGRAQLRIFEPAMLVEVERHQTMIASARYALQNDAILPHYQPKISLRSLEPVGFEALLRWTDRDARLQGPGPLMAAFDDPALGGVLSERMLEKVLDDVQQWVRADLPFGHIAINVAAAEFRRGRFAETMLARLATRGIPPSRIQIEVTETVFLGQSAEDVKEALGRLSDQGIRIALDDFGTGYASLSHLNQFPVHLLKIDRSFVDKIGTSAEAEAISTTVVNLGHCLGLEVVAEGVESRAQETRLRAMGCDTAQGFLYSAALPGAEIAPFLESWNAAVPEQRRA